MKRFLASIAAVLVLLCCAGCTQEEPEETQTLQTVSTMPPQEPEEAPALRICAITYLRTQDRGTDTSSHWTIGYDQADPDLVRCYRDGVLILEQRFYPGSSQVAQKDWYHGASYPKRIQGYDQQGRLVSDSSFSSPEYLQWRSLLTYGKSGLSRKTTTYAGGRVLEEIYTYDQGKLVLLVETENGKTVARTNHIYDDRGREWKQIRMEGVYNWESIYSYDSNGRVSHFQGIDYEASYRYDDAGNLVELRKLSYVDGQSDSLQSCVYDDRGQLLERAILDGTGTDRQVLRYDGAGHLVFRQDYREEGLLGTLRCVYEDGILTEVYGVSLEALSPWGDRLTDWVDQEGQHVYAAIGYEDAAVTEPELIRARNEVLLETMYQGGG
ncbi:MAG: hypothetical protein IJW45_06765 [Oscillospiraceae bacterium]|nr:hypothetical protein [Oscillospiraceae bacterium]